jgi:hypothetical protein
VIVVTSMECGGRRFAGRIATITGADGGVADTASPAGSGAT